MYNRVTSLAYNPCHVRFSDSVDGRTRRERRKPSDIQQTVYKTLIVVFFLLLYPHICILRILWPYFVGDEYKL